MNARPKVHAPVPASFTGTLHEPFAPDASDASGVDVELDVDEPQPTAAAASTTTARSWIPPVMMEA